MVEFEDSRISQILTVDLEDWYHGHYPGYSFSKYENSSSRIIGPTYRLLDLFSKYKYNATFFVLGTVAEHYPDIVANNRRAISRNETVSTERTAPTTKTVNDNKAPEISSLIPDPNSFHVSRGTVIQLHITDGGSGVEYGGGAVTIRVEGDLVYDSANETSPGEYDSVSMYPEQSVNGICTRTGSQADYTFVFRPTSPFDYGQKVDVTVNAMDRAGNIMPEANYYFHTVNSSIVASCVWRMFIFSILSAIGAIITEIKLPENWMIERKSVEN